MMKRNIFLFVVLVVLVWINSPVLADNPIELKAIQFIILGNQGEKGFHLFVDNVNKSAKGKLVIKIVGGPESIPARQQFEAVRTGAVDIAFIPSSWYGSVVPAAAALNLSLLEPWDQRKSGLHDYMVQEHKKAGLRFIGVGNVNDPFYLYAKEPFKSPAELRGKRFRHSPTFAWYKGLGLIPITTSQGEIYTGLQRNLFVGLANKPAGFLEVKLYQICKYVIGPPWWPYSGNLFLMNEKKFSGLSKDLQEVILKAQEDAEPVMKDIQEEYSAAAWKEMYDNGMEHIKWSPEDTKYFLDRVNELTWEARTKRIPPDEAAKLKKMMGY